MNKWTQAPLQLEKKAVLNWPQACVFDLLANHKKWPRIFPWLQNVTVDNSQAIIKNGLGAKRICNFGNGMILEELIVGWKPSVMYAYAGLDETNPFGMTGHVSVVHCIAIEEKNTRLSWQHYFNHANPIAMQAQLDSSLTAAMQSLIACCGGYSETDFNN